MSLKTTNDFLTDLSEKLGRREFGYNGYTLGVELNGGQIVDILAVEPDAATYRGWYYYNAVRNILYKKIVTDFRPYVGIIRAHWLRVSAH